jgi:hypothetical protein
MSDSYLEVTYRHGRPLAAYYYLPRARPAKSARTRRVEPGLVIDYSASGQPLGMEITAPSKLSMAALNRVLRTLSCAPLRRADFRPNIFCCMTGGRWSPISASHWR